MEGDEAGADAEAAGAEEAVAGAAVFHVPPAEEAGLVLLIPALPGGEVRGHRRHAHRAVIFRGLRAAAETTRVITHVRQMEAAEAGHLNCPHAQAGSIAQAVDGCLPRPRRGPQAVIAIWAAAAHHSSLQLIVQVQGSAQLAERALVNALHNCLHDQAALPGPEEQTVQEAVPERIDPASFQPARGRDPDRPIVRAPYPRNGPAKAISEISWE